MGIIIIIGSSRPPQTPPPPRVENRTLWRNLGPKHKPRNLTGEMAKLKVRQIQHIPLFDFLQSTPACIFGAMVIFKPKDGEIACCIAGKQELIDEINQSGMVGKPLEKLTF